MFNGQKIRQLLQEKDITVTDFAEQIGVQRAHIWHLISQHRPKIRFETVERLADGFGVSMDVFRVIKEK